MVKFKEFKVGDLFEISTTKGINIDGLVNPTQDNKIRYITRTSFDNGIQGFTGKLKDVLPNEANTFSLGLMSMDFFYQDEIWYSGQYVRKITPKFEMSKNMALYFSVLFNRQKDIYKGVLVNSLDSLFKNSLISLPITSTGEVDYQYMEDYIKGIQRQYIDNLIETNEAERNRLLSIVGLSLDEYERVKGNIELCDATSYGEFKVGDLLDGYIGTFVSDEFRNERKTDEFIIPLITSQTTNNGIQAYVKKGAYRELEDCLSISKDGINAGTVFYQKGKFTLGNVAMGMFAKESCKEHVTKNVYLFLASHIEKSAKSFGGYDKKVGWNIFDFHIQLPTTQTGEVDYAYMDDYISKIKLIYIYTIGNYLLTNK